MWSVHPHVHRIPVACARGVSSGPSSWAAQVQRAVAGPDVVSLMRVYVCKGWVRLTGRFESKRSGSQSESRSALLFMPLIPLPVRRDPTATQSQTSRRAHTSICWVMPRRDRSMARSASGRVHILTRVLLRPSCMEGAWTSVRGEDAGIVTPRQAALRSRARAPSFVGGAKRC